MRTFTSTQRHEKEFEDTKGEIRNRIWPNEKVQKDKQRSIKHTYKTKDRVTRTPLKTGGELRCSGRASSSRSTSGTRRVNLVYLEHSRDTAHLVINNNTNESTHVLYLLSFYMFSYYLVVSNVLLYLTMQSVTKIVSSVTFHDEVYNIM